MKNCVFCRSEITTDTQIERSVSGDEICPKCHKNELKYGEPSLCKYCQLTAAFVDSKCVHCSYSERRHGPPQECSNCKLIAAFPKDPSAKNQKLFCRLCKFSQKRATSKAENTRKRVKEANSSPKHVFKHFKGSSFVTESVDSLGDQILAMTQLKDQVANLQRQLSQKDQAIIERDKKIASLSAKNMHLEKAHRLKLQQLQKEQQEAQEASQERIKTLSRQIASLSKGKRQILSDGASSSPSITS